MSNIIGLLDLGRGALLAHQQAISITGHNIANVNTPGYSRQRVNLSTNPGLTSSPGQIGAGVKASDIQRIYDQFLGSQINAESYNLGKWEAQTSSLERVEIVFDETTGFGLNQAMGDFFNAWQDLTNNPEGHTERQMLVAKSEIMAETFNKISSDLNQLQNDMDSSIEGAVSEINTMAGQISDLNAKISDIEKSGQNANDLRDKRDLYLKELSSMIDISTFEGNDGQVTVLVGNGKPLVQPPYSLSLSTVTNASGHQNVVWVDRDGNNVDITNDISGGKLKGWLEVRDVAIEDYKTRLDNVASSIIAEVNNLHGLGFDLNGIAGGAFFTGTSASDIAIDTNIVNNVNLIAASGTGAPGDNSNAIAIANLQNSLLMSGGTATYDDFYNSLVSDVGIAVQFAQTNYDHQTAMVANLDNYRESISGVSLDEEMVNLVKFQHAYDAAAKLITAVDEMMNTVMNMV
ncbi:MAG: flagellar hook-associated protein FlgK [Thermodesulfobacteriota bacterium]|nr:flagellar hook-associated protein FlgK [Thermodesulfobacteriota bacterium]